MAVAERIECQACPADNPADATGYSNKDLAADGWRFQTLKDENGKVKGQPFAMCPACVLRYEPAWEAEATTIPSH